MSYADNAMFVCGNTGESNVRNLLTYTGDRFYQNIYLESSNGSISQIDFLLVGRSSLVSIEVKSYTRCVIKGDKDGFNWTACYRRGPKTFYNPLMQNERHIKTLRECIGSVNVPIWNIVVFSNGCNIRVNGAEGEFYSVIDMSELWYRLSDINNYGKSMKSEERDAITQMLDSFVVRTYELSEKHKATHFNR